MGLNAVKILKISITTDPKEKILEYLNKYLVHSPQFTEKREKKQPKPLVIVTPNPEQIVYAHRNPWFSDVLNRADVALPDGIGLLIADRLVHSSQFIVNRKKLQKRIPGVEFMEELVQLAVKQRIPIGLIGGRNDLAVRAFECLRVKYPGLTGWGIDGPYNIKYSIVNSKYKDKIANILIEQDGKDVTEEYIASVRDKIRKTGVGMVFVGLGAPKQECFIEAIVHSSQFTVNSKNNSNSNTSIHNELGTKHSLILMSVGGSFDIIAGRLKRAPLLYRSIGFEWVWRLVHEPWRWRRQLALFEFLWLVLRERLS